MLGVFFEVSTFTGVIAATLRVFRREIYFQGKALLCAGIGEVSTLPAFRRKGLAGRLLQEAAEYAATKE